MQVMPEQVFSVHSSKDSTHLPLGHLKLVVGGQIALISDLHSLTLLAQLRSAHLTWFSGHGNNTLQFEDVASQLPSAHRYFSGSSRQDKCGLHLSAKCLNDDTQVPSAHLNGFSFGHPLIFGQV
jgi:hypothetical protein